MKLTNSSPPRKPNFHTLTVSLLAPITLLLSSLVHAETIKFEDIDTGANDDINATSHISGSFTFTGASLTITGNAGDCCVSNGSQFMIAYGNGPYEVTMARTNGEPFTLYSLDYAHRDKFTPDPNSILQIQYDFTSGLRLFQDLNYDSDGDNFQSVRLNTSDLASVTFRSNDYWLVLDEIKAFLPPLEQPVLLPGEANAIDVGGDGSVWKIDNDLTDGGYTISQWNPSNYSWDSHPGGGERIAVDDTGAPWVLNSNQDLWQGEPAGNNYVNVTQLSGGWDIDAGASGTVMYVGNAESRTVYQWLSSSWSAFTSTPGTASIERVAVTQTGLPWVALTNGEMYRYSTSGDWLSVAGTGFDIDIGANGAVYHLGQPLDANNDRPIYKGRISDPDAWEFTNSYGKEFAAGPSGQLWFIDYARRIWTTDADAATLINNPAAEGYPFYFNGTAPNATANIGLNNVGDYQESTQLINTCLRIVSNGFPDIFLGYSEWDAVFELTTANDFGSLKFLRARPFNESRSLVSTGELPDCSGSVDLITLAYADHVNISGQTYRVRYNLEDDVELIFTNSSIVQVSQ